LTAAVVAALVARLPSASAIAPSLLFARAPHSPTIVGAPTIGLRAPLASAFSASPFRMGSPLASSIILPSLGPAVFTIYDLSAHRIAVWRRALAFVRRGPRFLFPARPDLLLVVVPLRLFRVLVLLTRIAVLAAGPPFRITVRLLLVAVCIPRRTRTLPSTFALAEPLLARGVTRLPELTALEPLQLCVGMPFAKAIEGREQLLDVVRAERCRLIVDDDRPVRMSRRHITILRRRHQIPEGAHGCADSDGGVAGAFARCA
jgi:hypothetical protein